MPGHLGKLEASAAPNNGTAKLRHRRADKVLMQKVFKKIAIGWHWCAYVENTARGWGIKNPWDKLYREFVEPVTAFNKYIYDKV